MLKSKHLLGMEYLDADEILLILEKAKQMKSLLSNPSKKTTHLQGKSVVNLFLENSTRTRLSFELAEKYMGATAANMSGSGSSVLKGESLKDTAVTLDRMATDFIVIRHAQSGSAAFISEYVNASVINAGDGMHEHPTQSLLDLYTMKENNKNFKNLKVVMLGDCLHSRVFRSNALALKKLGASLYVSGPSSLMPRSLEDFGVVYEKNPRKAVEGADVVMGLRLQLERMGSALFPSVREYAKFYGISKELMSYAKSDALLMHPGPANRGVEISTEAYEMEQSYISEQVTNGVAVRMAVLSLLNTNRNRQQL